MDSFNKIEGLPLDLNDGDSNHDIHHEVIHAALREIKTEINRNVPNQTTAVSVASFPDSNGNIRASSFSQAAAAAGLGGTILIPRGVNVQIETPIDLLDVNITSNGAVVQVTNDFGPGNSAITITGTGECPISYVENFRLRGPGIRGNVGTKPSNCDGITIANNAKVKFRHVQVDLFNKGFILDSDLGHLYWDRCNSTNNYYGMYLRNNSSDYFILDSEFNGNTFAGIGMPSDQGFDGGVFANSHMGFQPYGIYQEPTTRTNSSSQGSPRVFLQDMILSHTRFEYVGNGAIVSDAPATASDRSFLNGVKIIQPGFSWSPLGPGTFNISSRPKSYAVDIGWLDRTLEIDSGSHPFTSGTVGVIRVKNATSSSAISLQGAPGEVNDQQVVVSNGPRNVSVFDVPSRFSLSGTNVNRFLDMGTGSGYVRPDGTNSRRFGGDAAGLYIDSSLLMGRDPNNNYNFIWSAQPNGLSANRVYTGVQNVQDSTKPFITSINGVPEGALAAPVGSVCQNISEVTGDAIYVKTGGGNGITGWSKLINDNNINEAVSNKIDEDLAVALAIAL